MHEFVSLVWPTNYEIYGPATPHNILLMVDLTTFSQGRKKSEISQQTIFVFSLEKNFRHESRSKRANRRCVSDLTSFPLFPNFSKPSPKPLDVVDHPWSLRSWAGVKHCEELSKRDIVQVESVLLMDLLTRLIFCITLFHDLTLY